ncbi:MAG: UPF0179 family protein [Thermoplasmatota archaeon]
MSEVTLIGEHLAKEGLEFVFGGCLSRCQNCEIKNSCCGLKKNKWYRITGVRDKKHQCKIHYGDVKVVEVEDIPFETAVPVRTAIKGSTVKLEEKNCNNRECEHYRICHPIGITYNEKYHIEDVKEKINCSQGLELKSVKLR